MASALINKIVLKLIASENKLTPTAKENLLKAGNILRGNKHTHSHTRKHTYVHNCIYIIT